VQCWASVHLGEAGLLLPPSEFQVTAFLPSVGNLAFLLFNRGTETLPLSGSGECWASAPWEAIFWEIQNSRFALCGRAGVLALGQVRLGFPASR
jgi:hypothetical protein